MSEWLSASEAAAALGISVSSLYAYVSRGLLTSEAVSGTRQRRYSRADVEAMQTRRAIARDPGLAVQTALDHGAPVLDSAISLIRDGRLYYRGQDVVQLATTSTVEDVARLVWGVDVPFPRGAVDEAAFALAASTGLSPVEALQTALPLACARDVGAWDPRPQGLAACGARILRLAVAVATGEPSPGDVAATLATSWSTDAALVSMALVLCADHELNVSAFTARCVASAGATPYHVVNAGLCALQGGRHGGHTSRVEALFAEAEREGASAAISARLRRGEAIPGFGHRLYPAGDPRGRALCEAVLSRRADPVAVALIASAGDAVGLQPTIDFGLVALRRTGLPAHAALTLFALGRTIGWVGHAIEQAPGELIRPRARYVGPEPA